MNQRQQASFVSAIQVQKVHALRPQACNILIDVERRVHTDKTRAFREFCERNRGSVVIVLPKGSNYCVQQ